MRIGTTGCFLVGWLLCLSPAWAKPLSSGAEQVAKEFESGLKGQGIESTLGQDVARRLVEMLGGRDPDHASVAAFGLGFAADAESLQALERAAKEPITVMVGACARTALAWRASRGQPAEARKRSLVTGILATKEVLDRLSLMALMARFYAASAENDLLQVMDGDTDSRAWVAIYSALLLERSQKRSVVERVAKRVEAMPFAEIPEGLCSFLCLVSGEPTAQGCFACTNTVIMKGRLARRLETMK